VDINLYRLEFPNGKGLFHQDENIKDEIITPEFEEHCSKLTSILFDGKITREVKIRFGNLDEIYEFYCAFSTENELVDFFSPLFETLICKWKAKVVEVVIDNEFVIYGTGQVIYDKREVKEKRILLEM
jgi:hypothetical protein